MNPINPKWDSGFRMTVECYLFLELVVTNLMTHNEKRQSSVREAQIALFTGSIYGAVHTVTGHPLDTIKSNMQVNVGAPDIFVLCFFLRRLLSLFLIRMHAKAWALHRLRRSFTASTAFRASSVDAGLPSSAAPSTEA